MAPNSKDEDKSSTLPGLWKYPTFRDSIIKSDSAWLDGRRLDDGAEGLWRIHDTLYDFTKFISNHPGGEEWLQLTKGTDITEAFESHHMSAIPRKMLDTYKVKQANTQRNSPYTFKSDGFYATLRKRIIEKQPEILKLHYCSPQSRNVIDILVLSTVLLALTAARLQSYVFAFLSGMTMAMIAAAAHNFIHLRYNWRRNYIHLAFLSTKHYATIHILSHHLYPNSVHDLEVSMLEPYLYWLPRTDKGWLRYASCIISPIVYTVATPTEFIRAKLTTDGLVWKDLITFSVPLAMFVVSGSYDVGTTLQLWLVIAFVTSFFIQACGLNAGHHHPDIFHDGDAARVDRDWGLAMLDSVQDRTFISGVTGTHTWDKNGRLKVNIEFKQSSLQFFLTLTNYGHHVLHHLFPTVDHYYLPKLYPILQETLQEFGEVYTTSSITEQIKGQFQQLLKIEPNVVPPGPKKPENK